MPGVRGILPGVLYRLVFDLVLSRLDAEVVHLWTLRLLGLVQRVPLGLRLARVLGGHADPSLRIRALGIDFPGPLGLAAGFDKDGEVFDALGAFGFDFVEVGTVTGQPQPGNPRPRMARLPRDRALVNRMGFNNHGSAAAAGRLRGRRSGGPVIGANIGKTKVVPVDAAVDDYTSSAARLAPLADYLVVNVSSPNTPGLRDLQSVESLRPLLHGVLEACRAEGHRPPVLVKIAPDLADADVDAVADLVLELGLDGVIATNTTIDRSGLRSTPDAVESAGGGGLSGAPLAGRSMQLLRRLHDRVGDRAVLISVGGIETADDVWDRLVAGATLVQAYTGMVYAGPLFARRIHTGLQRRLRAEGLGSLEELIAKR